MKKKVREIVQKMENHPNSCIFHKWTDTKVNYLKVRSFMFYKNEAIKLLVKN